MNLKANDTIVIGMDGGLESAVAAYLLKKQGHQCIGISVIYHEKDEDFNDILSPFLPDELEHIKTICKTLEIPFYATNASELYFEKVVDKVLAARLSGKAYEPTVDRTVVIFETLIEKAKQLGANIVATGHSCKILKNQNTGKLNLFRSNDLDEDDSYYLSKVPYNLLDKIYLPLSELKSEEIIKISKLIPVDFRLDKEQRRVDRLNFMKSNDLYEFINHYTPKVMREEGMIMSYYDSSTIGDHEGLSRYFIGQAEYPIKNKPNTDRDNIVTRIIPSQSLIYIDKRERQYFTHCHIYNFKAEENLNRSLPMDCYVMLEPRGEMHQAKCYFKNNNNLLIEYKDKVNGLCPRGTYAVLYTKKGIGARIIGSGFVRSSGYWDDDHFREIAKTKEEEEMLQEEKPKRKDLGF